MKKRMHLFEFEDQAWLPSLWRKMTTEFLATVTRITRLWEPTSEVLKSLLESSKDKKIIVIGAGSGGGIMDILPHIPKDVSIVFTDLYPNIDFKCEDPRVAYSKESVNATMIPRTLEGVRVMYATFHHFNPTMARQVLEDAVKARQPIAIFEGTERTIKGVLAVLLVPLMVLLITPFVLPWRWSRIVFTYILPVMPVLIFWDGLVSALRTYSLEEMESLVSDLTEFSWRVQNLKGPRGENIPSLIGQPK